MTYVLMKFARAIVRLYPRAWRARYEDEMLALVEQSGLTAFRALDLMLGAAQEWTREIARLLATRPGFRTFLAPLVMTGLITALGLTIALWLRANVVTPPVISYVDGQRGVLPPRLPGYFAISWSVLVVAIFVGDWRAFLATKAGRPVARHAPAAVGWLVALAVTVPGAIWDALVSHYGTGLAPAPGMRIAMIVMFTFSSLQSLTSRLAGASPQLPS